MAAANGTTPIAIRALQPSDLDAVVAIDRSICGRSRRVYIERRLQAALREPARHAQFAATEAGALAGFILARLLHGEFGRSEPALRIELVGVRRDAQRRGIGSRLLETLAGHARRKGVLALRTAAAWNDHAILRWIDAAGFALAPERIVDCPVDDGSDRRERDAAAGPIDGAGTRREVDFGAGAGNDFERLARDRADLRSMAPDDLAAIVRIDRALTGRDRGAYVRAQLAEALDDSAVRVSLVARFDGLVVGYLMARTDLGDYGRTEPVAVIDTIGVDPGYAKRGAGQALLSQLFVNLGALRVERIETIAAPRDLALLGFLYARGFAPSQRLAFVRALA